MTLTDGTQLSFTYNSEGLRTSKTVGSDTVEYVWNGGNLISEIRNSYTLNFYYNGDEVMGFNYNGSDYYYGKDNLGVIKYLYDSNGGIVTTYTYNAWGEPISVSGTLASTVGTINPIRYKSYYCDTETGFYYLQIRYYDPTVERFINADELLILNIGVGVLTNNLMIYCTNNPILLFDPNGYRSYNINNRSISFRICAVNRYQFDYGSSFYGIPDSWNGRFVTFGWAKFFTSIGIMNGKMRFMIDKKTIISFS